MLQEYAVEPEAIVADWTTFRYVIEKFGVEQGRVVSRLPKRWARQVIDKANAIDQNLGKKVTEVLSNANWVVPFNRNFHEEETWLANAIREHALRPFAGIIAQLSCGSGGVQRTVAETDGQFFHCPRQVVVVRQAAALGACVAPLLGCARTLLLVDPHFDPTRPKWSRPLAEFLRVATRLNNRPMIIEYHTQWKDPRFNKGLWQQNFRNNCQHHLPGIVPAGCRLRVVLWNDVAAVDKMHARYILTDRGGVGVENGLDEGNSGDTTDVGILDRDVWKQRLAQYGDRPTYQLADDVTVIGTG